jgi:glycosyltransferase involved in cell wall biosynthesis
MRFYGNAARLHAVSRSVAAAIGEEAPRLRDRIRIIPYPVTLGTGDISGSDLPSKRRKRVLFVGRLHPEKGVHVLLGAFARIPEAIRRDWCLEIVGPEQVASGGGGAKYLRGLVDLAAPIAASVQWGGGVFEPSRLAEIYRSARIFVYPSLAEKGETFGLAPLEAMSFGCVPVVSRLSCFNEYVDDGVCGLTFDHAGGEPERALTQVLVELMENEERVEKLAVAALGKAQHFSLERIARMHLDDFSAVLEESRQRSAGRKDPSLAVARHGDG